MKVKGHVNSRVVVIGTSLAILVAAGAWWFTPEQEATLPAHEETVDQSVAAKQTTAPQESQRTIATEWQWDEVASSEEERSESGRYSGATAEFDVTVIYDNLQAVRLDEEGDVIMDDVALRALDEALDHGELELTGADLEELQELIRIGLPGKAGEQTAGIVGDYYEFLGAKQEFEAVYEAADTVRDFESEYEELVALRELYLGEEVARQLFAESDKEARFMLKSMALEADSSLDPEEREERQRELARQHYDKTPDIPDWDRRYQAYRQEKQYILDAGLAEEEQERQLRQLASQHFTENEIGSVERYEERDDQPETDRSD